MGTRKTTATTPYYRCLGSHLPHMCQFKQAECYKYHKSSYIARVCKSRQNHQGTELGKSTKKTHYVEDSLQSNEQSLTINSTHNLYHCWEWTQPHYSGTNCGLQYTSSIITFMVEISSLSQTTNHFYFQQQQTHVTNYFLQDHPMDNHLKCI